MKCLLILSLLAPLPAIAAPKCEWVSEPTPDAVIQIGEVSPIGILSADLMWQGKVIRTLLMGQPNGYGSRWWAYKGQDGESVGGGRLVTFRGDQPTRGTNPEVLDQSAPRKAMLVGLGGDLYYTDFRGELDLIRAGEGFWQVPSNCNTPGRGGW